MNLPWNQQVCNLWQDFLLIFKNNFLFCISLLTMAVAGLATFAFQERQPSTGRQSL